METFQVAKNRSRLFSPQEPYSYSQSLAKYNLGGEFSQYIENSANILVTAGMLQIELWGIEQEAQVGQEMDELRPQRTLLRVL